MSAGDDWLLVLSAALRPFAAFVQTDLSSRPSLRSRTPPTAYSVSNGLQPARVATELERFVRSSGGRAFSAAVPVLQA